MSASCRHCVRKIQVSPISSTPEYFMFAGVAVDVSRHHTTMFRHAVGRSMLQLMLSPRHTMETMFAYCCRVYVNRWRAQLSQLCRMHREGARLSEWLALDRYLYEHSRACPSSPGYQRHTTGTIPVDDNVQQYILMIG